MKLILVRHGETEGNVKQIIQGQTHGKLTKKGIKQAKLLARRLKNEKIDVVFSSDLQRAKNTTKQILNHHCKIPVFYDKLLSCLLYTSPSPRDLSTSRMPSSA